MEDLVPRHIKAAEAQLLGIAEGWYATKVSGTLMTSPFANQNECEKEIKVMTARSAKLARSSEIILPVV